MMEVHCNDWMVIHEHGCPELSMQFNCPKCGDENCPIGVTMGEHRRGDRIEGERCMWCGEYLDVILE